MELINKKSIIKEDKTKKKNLSIKALTLSVGLIVGIGSFTSCSRKSIIGEIDKNNIQTSNNISRINNEYIKETNKIIQNRYKERINNISEEEGYIEEIGNVSEENEETIDINPSIVDIRDIPGEETIDIGPSIVDIRDMPVEDEYIEDNQSIRIR